MKKIVATAALLLALVIVPRLISAAYMESAGVLVTGKVVAKREAFLMPGGDTERHIFEITYEYHPGDAHYRETIVQRVDASFFRRLGDRSVLDVDDDEQKVRLAPAPFAAGLGQNRPSLHAPEETPLRAE